MSVEKAKRKGVLKIYLFILIFCLSLTLSPLAQEKAAETPVPAPTEAPAPAGAPIIKEIKIEGLKRIEEKTVLKAISSKAGKPLSKEKVKNDQQDIYSLGHFTENIEAETKPFEGGVILIFKVKENPFVEEIKFIGNKKFKAKPLKNSIPQKEKEYLNSRYFYRSKEALIEKYKNSGYSEIKVDIEKEEIAPDKIRLVITIDEGERIKIKDIIIKGNKKYSSLNLKFGLENQGSWLFIKNYYDKDAFEEDLKKIKYYYQGKGYLDVEVTKGDFIYNENKGWVSPVILIKEGSRYRVGKIEPENYSVFNKGEILSLFKELPGSYFNSKQLATSMDKLYRMYGDEGYINLSCKFDYNKDTAKHIADIKIIIEENKRIYVRNVMVNRENVEYDDLNFFEKFYIKLAPPLNPDVIWKEVRFKPGSVYRTYDEVRTVERLNALGFLSNVSIERELTDEEDERNIIINYKEEDRGRAALSVGYGELDGFFVSAEYNEPNLLGEANNLNVSGLLGTRHRQLSLNYLDRYIGASKDSLQYSAYYDEYYYSYLTDRITGASAEYGHPLSEYLKLYIRQRFEHVEFADFGEDINERPDDYDLAATRVRLVEDKRDDQKWPTKGTYKSLGIEGGYAKQALVKFTGRYSWYKNFYKSLIFATNAEAGLLPYRADRIGYNERFFLGGADDLRGFAPKGAGPKDSGEENMPRGGATKLLLQNELRFPIMDPFRGVIFLDAGTLEDRFLEVGKPKVSAGVGLRWDMKRFYMSLDFAKVLVKDKDDKKQFFHFTAGSKF